MTVMTASTTSRAARALGLASASVLCFLAASALGITVLGKVHRPEIEMDLAPPPPAHLAAAPHAATVSTPPPAAIDKQIFAGRALIADPALIENTPQGPLPRVADDGRTPMAAYAAPALSGKLRIAIVVSGLGLSAKSHGGGADRSSARSYSGVRPLCQRCAALGLASAPARSRSAAGSADGAVRFS